MIYKVKEWVRKFHPTVKVKDYKYYAIKYGTLYYQLGINGAKGGSVKQLNDKNPIILVPINDFNVYIECRFTESVQIMHLWLHTDVYVPKDALISARFFSTEAKTPGKYNAMGSGKISEEKAYGEAQKDSCRLYVDSDGQIKSISNAFFDNLL